MSKRKPLCADAWTIPPSPLMLSHGNDYYTCSSCGEKADAPDEDVSSVTTLGSPDNPIISRLDETMTTNTEPVPTRAILERLYHAGWSAHRASLDSRNSPGLRALEEEAIDDAEAQLQRICASERVKALIRLEQWAKLHDLDAAMILDGIEHMALSELQFPEQRHVDYPQRYAELQTQLEGESK